MMRNTILNTVAGACFLLPTAFAQAQEKSEAATIRLSHNVLRYGMAKEKKEASGTTTDQDISGLTTFPAGIEIAAFVNGYSIYAYPVTQGGSIWLGKAIAPNMELGVTASLNSRNVKDGDEKSDNSIGAYYFYSRPLTPSVTFEMDVNPALIIGSGKSTSGGTTPVESKSEDSGYSFYLDLLGVVPIAKNFEYVFGLDYTMKKYDSKVKTGGVSNTVKYNNSDFGIILAKFRFFI